MHAYDQNKAGNSTTEIYCMFENGYMLDISSCTTVYRLKLVQINEVAR